jgi:hypothetical protein
VRSDIYCYRRREKQKIYYYENRRFVPLVLMVKTDWNQGKEFGSEEDCLCRRGKNET